MCLVAAILTVPHSVTDQTMGETHFPVLATIIPICAIDFHGIGGFPGQTLGALGVKTELVRTGTGEASRGDEAD